MISLKKKNRRQKIFLDYNNNYKNTKNKIFIKDLFI